MLVPDQMRRRLGDGDFQGGAHMALHQVAAPRGAVGEAQHGMGVKVRLAFVILGDITD